MKQFTPPQITTTIQKPGTNLPAKQLLWPGYTNGGVFFDDLTSSTPYYCALNRLKLKDSSGSKAFWEKAQVAQSVYILDPYIVFEVMAKIRDHLMNSTYLQELKILCRASDDAGRINDTFEDLKKVILKRAKVPCVFELKQSNNLDPLHDRYAVLDDELWHFGSTVGGLHEGITSFSRGWSADEHKFLDLFNALWRGYE